MALYSEEVNLPNFVMIQMKNFCYHYLWNKNTFIQVAIGFKKYNIVVNYHQLKSEK